MSGGPRTPRTSAFVISLSLGLPPWLPAWSNTARVITITATVVAAVEITTHLGSPIIVRIEAKVIPPPSSRKLSCSPPLIGPASEPLPRKLDLLAREFEKLGKDRPRRVRQSERQHR